MPGLPDPESEAMTEPNDPIVIPSVEPPIRAPDAHAQDAVGGPVQDGVHLQNGESTQASAPVQNGGSLRYSDATPNGGPIQNGGPVQNGEQERGTTAAQLRRFIKSRPYVPMHELRRRFELNGDCDDVVAMETAGGRCYIGLPEREGRFMADLVRQGEVGIELGHDPEVPIVVGVFPMRPVGR